MFNFINLKNNSIAIIEGRNFVAHEIYYLKKEEDILNYLEDQKDVILKNKENIVKMVSEIVQQVF